jgi:hypothetical protein
MNTKIGYETSEWGFISYKYIRIGQVAVRLKSQYSLMDVSLISICVIKKHLFILIRLSALFEMVITRHRYFYL